MEEDKTRRLKLGKIHEGLHRPSQDLTMGGGGGGGVAIIFNF